MILTCPFCKTKVRPADQDCPACRQRMTRRCPACAENVAMNAAACKYCGEELRGGAAPLRVAAPTPGIEFIEETKSAAPKKKRKCCGGRWLVFITFLTLLAGLVVRAPCVSCSAMPEHEVCLTTHTSVSHCGRKLCKEGRTRLWVSVYESLGGHVRDCR